MPPGRVNKLRPVHEPRAAVTVGQYTTRLDAAESRDAPSLDRWSMTWRQ
jgi:hypothetical protein